ncbi:MAG TPA: C4-type zinc ribbon domain-containing protein [Acidobacteriaceae bacterium]|nr:C4-type zinc ribbon domain-containing protein [Acidobacteriaceae bacterium]
MRNELEAMIRLQTIDGETAQLRAEIAALPKRLAALETKLQGEKAALELAAKAQKDEEALRRRQESDLKDQQQKIVKLRGQMASVKTNEEYRAFQHEIEFAEAEIKKIEDGELESMERTEQLAQKLKAAESDLKDSTKAVEIEKEDARAESAEQQKRLEDLLHRGGAERKTVSEPLLREYDRISSSRGTAVAYAQGQRCLSCHMGIRPQMWNQIRDGQVMTCESCGRLLFYDVSREPKPAPVMEKPKRGRKKAPEAGVE